MRVRRIAVEPVAARVAGQRAPAPNTWDANGATARTPISVVAGGFQRLSGCCWRGCRRAVVPPVAAGRRMESTAEPPVAHRLPRQHGENVRLPPPVQQRAEVGHMVGELVVMRGDLDVARDVR